MGAATHAALIDVTKSAAMKAAPAKGSAMGAAKHAALIGGHWLQATCIRGSSANGASVQAALMGWPPLQVTRQW